MRIRRIRPEDDAAIAAVIRTVMPEFGASGPGFAIHDAEVDGMHEAYSGPRSAYFVVCDEDERVLGGGGIAPLQSGDPETCELKKMYFLKEARGKGMGRRLLELCLEAARERGFKTCYLETFGPMESAQALYERMGFEKLEGPMGCTGHFSCDRWYSKRL